MSLLLSIGGWEIEAWDKRFRSFAPGRAIQHAGAADLDLSVVEYGVAWQSEQGLFARCPNLKAVFSLGAGVDHLMRDTTLPDVPVLRIVDPNLTMRMTEWVVLQVLMHHRQQDRLQMAQQASDWRDLPQWSADEVRVGILGLGNLGQDSADKLSRLGFQVAGWSRSKKHIPGLESFAGNGADGLDAFLARTDILVCLLPLTAETTNILNYDLFSKLSRSGPLGAPVIINAGRGGQQVEADILRALDDGTLHAASLDVFNEEPLPATSSFWAHPRVYVTPHLAAESHPDHMCRNIIDQINAFEHGEAFKNRVDMGAGY